jgi:hypothetical protein
VDLPGFGTAYTDDQGRFQFLSAMPLDALRMIVVDHKDYDRQEYLHYREPDLTRLKFVLSRGPVSIQGRVALPDGTKPALTLVSFYQMPAKHLRRKVTCDQSGNFLIRGTFTFEARLEVTFPNGEFAGVVKELLLKEDPMPDLLVMIEEGAILVGNAFNRAGTAGDRDFELILADGTVLYRGRLDGGGGYRIPHVSPGEYILRIGPAAVPVTSNPFTISGTGETRIDFDLDAKLVKR